MKKKLITGLLITLALTLGFCLCVVYGLYLGPTALQVENIKIESSQIPASFTGVRIGYFSDIYYLEYMDKERLEDMFETIEQSQVDILLFGGDVFSNPLDPNIDADTINEITQMLSDLDAPLGKFYVMGDIDNTNTSLIQTIMYNAGFEGLYNANVKLHNGKNESITLIALDNDVNGNVAIETAFANTSADNFNILLTHTPDNFSQVSLDIVDLGIGGHTLGEQTPIPFLNNITEIESKTRYTSGEYHENNTTFYVNNGLGTTNSDFRLFSPPQFHVFTLQSTK